MPRYLSKELQRVLLDTVLSLGNQARLAEQLGVNQATVSRWLAGRQGMDVAQCLRLAKLTHQPIDDILRWSNHEPDDYLDTGGLPKLSPDAERISTRVRILDWERRRASIPEQIRPHLDDAIEAILKSYQEACEEAKHQQPRRRRSDDRLTE